MRDLEGIRTKSFAGNPQGVTLRGAVPHPPLADPTFIGMR